MLVTPDRPCDRRTADAATARLLDSLDMPAITREEVAHLARLARIDMTGDDLDRMAGQLDAIVEAVAAVSGVIERAAAAGDDVPATSHPIPLRNVTRPDVPTPSLDAEAALAAAPASEGGRFLVPRILDED
jgi:aspartyl-tRNA(Asn)/glutamyl-tRNA(Gln) amidotransferase subunit C